MAISILSVIFVLVGLCIWRIYYIKNKTEIELNKVKQKEVIKQLTKDNEDIKIKVAKERKEYEKAIREFIDQLNNKPK